MKKVAAFLCIVIIIALTGCSSRQNLQVSVIDSDYDGVLDRYDKCPNTLFTKQVDITGCPTK